MNDNERLRSTHPRRIGLLLAGSALLIVAACGGAEDATPQTDATDTTKATEATEATEATSEVSSTDSATSTDCFEAVDHATSSCTSDLLVIQSDGLPEHQMMVGIDANGWNGQWPEAQDYTGNNAFFLPLDPTLAAEPQIQVMNAAGVAANGIPIFLPQSPGSEDDPNCIILLGDGQCLRDSVAAGEMDDCGGHTGRGNDYHYHGAPICLIETLEDGAIAGFMLDGVPIYTAIIAGSEPYNECGGYLAPDGIVYYVFTDVFPYVTNCLIGEFSPGPRTDQSEVYTGGYTNEELGGIVGFDNGDVCHTMTFENGVTLSTCDG